MKGTIDRLDGLLGGITDVASAKAASPALEDVAGGVDKLTGWPRRCPTPAERR
jgi:hypothetical protein